MEYMKKYFQKIYMFIKKHKWSVLLILLALMVGGFFIYDSLSATFGLKYPGFMAEKEKEILLVKAPFSGLEITDEQSNKRPLAVVIENSPDARPQSGLMEADIVFETLAEGGITRFLAIFQSQEANEIGPVRSARPYFVDWVLGYDALFAHVGGSQEALNQIISKRVYDINQFYFGSYFWRSSERYAPHNVYTTTEKLRKAAASKSYPLEKTNISALSFKEDLPLEERLDVQRFKVEFNYNYGPIYTYSKECNCYLRSFEGGKHIDATSGKQLSAKNVIVLFSDMGSMKVRSSTYTTIDTVGSGKAFYYLDGKKTEGTWARTSLESPLKFYGSDKQEIQLNIGTTWIDVVPQGTSVK